MLNEDFDFFETDENTPKELLNHGMDVNACGGFEQNALRTQPLSFYVCRYLIGEGIDVNQCDNSGRTPLFRDAHNSEITKKNAEAGADLHAIGFAGKNPLSADDIAPEVRQYLIGQGLRIQD